MTQRVVVVGATGQIVRPLCRELLRAGNLVTVFSRDPVRAQHVVPGATGYVAWSPVSLPKECVSHLEWADAVVYLAGGPLPEFRLTGPAPVRFTGREWDWPGWVCWWLG